MMALKIPHIKKSKKKTVKVGHHLTKLSGSAYAINFTLIIDDIIIMII